MLSRGSVERTRELIRQAARALAALVPEGWIRVDAIFASTVAAETAVAYYSDGERAVPVLPPSSVLDSVREHRRLSAEYADGPWWRLLLSVTGDGQIEADYDYGDEPFPAEQLFPPEAYRADLEIFPRKELPVWLAAYLNHRDRQVRSPLRAAAQAHTGRPAGAHDDSAGVGLPPLPVLAARWAVLAAAFVAAGSEWGPRLLPALRWFEGTGRSGSSLYALPGGRAVLSGGVWNAQVLDRAYNQGAPLPDLYRGAPEWVADPVLNNRAAHGMLTFCYWWDGSCWNRGESPEVGEVAEAVPGVWDSGTVARIIGDLTGAANVDEPGGAVSGLVAAAESAAVTRSALAAVFPEAGESDIADAYYQLHMGGIAAAEPLPEGEAIARVARELTGSGMELSDYPVDGLRADRMNMGWMVYVPVPQGEVAVGRAIFYIADDGVMEWSSSSEAPSRYVVDFEERCRVRNRALL
ncbi:hypothetical protein [Nocardia sp. NPDC051750]|uniref:hypothetical protein n=1 Tax=Nocardia sp. NPDC051750 TaxID=3364325 RepID=UPI0037B90875